MPAGTERSPGLERETIGRYELLLELGRGGMAVLYLARARGVGGFARMFAIKRILPHLAADPVFVDMFLDEGRIAARLSHPNLCPVFELGQDRGELFLVMDYLDGLPWETLAAAAPRDARGLALAAGVLAQACEGLHHAHTFRDVDGTPLPIVHRDVSPQNLFVSGDGTCRVLDFGVSKIATDRRRTRTGVRKGKLPYMAPEHIRGDALDGRADVWALGVMLWEALTGEHLFDRDTDFLTYQAITEAAVPPVAAAVPGAYPAALERALDRVLGRALARDRDQRHASARELAADLTELAAGAGGIASRAAIAAALAERCGDQLAARRAAIAAAVARRAAAEAAAAGLAGAAAVTPAGAAAAIDRDAADRDASATVSMAVRKDAIVVGRPRRSRRRWFAGALATAAVAIAAGLALHGRGDSAESPASGVRPSGAHMGAESRVAAGGGGDPRNGGDSAESPVSGVRPRGAHVGAESRVAAGGGGDPRNDGDSAESSVSGVRPRGAHVGADSRVAAGGPNGPSDSAESSASDMRPRGAHVGADSRVAAGGPNGPSDSAESSASDMRPRGAHVGAESRVAAGGGGDPRNRGDSAESSASGSRPSGAHVGAESRVAAGGRNGPGDSAEASVSGVRQSGAQVGADSRVAAGDPRNRGDSAESSVSGVRPPGAHVGAGPPGKQTIVSSPGAKAPHLIGAASRVPARGHTAVEPGGQRAAAPAVAPGWYAIDSTPYATIFIDDRKIGDTPLDRIALPAGKHRVRAVLADGRTREFPITIAAEQKLSAGTLRW